VDAWEPWERERITLLEATRTSPPTQTPPNPHHLIPTPHTPSVLTPDPQAVPTRSGAMDFHTIGSLISFT